jgi:hypothetical protein
MTVQRGPAGAGAKPRRATPRTPAKRRDQLADRTAHDVQRLGNALGKRVDDVLELTTARSRAAGQTLDPLTAESFAQIGRQSTRAVALWMAGGRPEAGRETGRKAFETYGQLAAQHVAPLNEVTKRCLRWRDAPGSWTCRRRRCRRPWRWCGARST